ncbi:hypothetical protein [uncultured Mycobacterium sp.]|uniref:hypothetical protein n=1 Tax=uncultured Mycobacterium sp. TaxID=171292 RepID=UPI0035C95951
MPRSGYASSRGAVDRIAKPWGTRTPYAPGTTWPQRIDCYLADGITPDSVDRWVQSAAVLHSNGDGLDIVVKEEYYTQTVIARGAIGTNTSTATPDCARPRLLRRSRSRSPATASPDPTPTSTTPT